MIIALRRSAQQHKLRVVEFDGHVWTLAFREPADPGPSLTRAPDRSDRRGEGFARDATAFADGHAHEPLDLVLISGDMTDAGISAEWAEFLDIVEAHPDLARRALILPGNHDV